MSTNKAVKYLVRDLERLKKEPIVGANACPLEDNIMIWYGIVVGAKDTPYEGIPIRFVLEFDENYPASAPKAFFDTPIKYTGGATYKVDGRTAVCLNIFGNFSHLHTEWKSASEGWSPSYTVSTILIAMQGLMLSDMLSQDIFHVQETVTGALDFICPKTGHVGADSTKWFPKVSLVDASTVTEIKKEEYNPYKDFYICYVNKSTHHDGALLGYGINIDNPKNGTLSSPCEYLSKEAFDEGIRNSSTNKPFGYWMPILVQKDLWTKSSIKQYFIASIKEISQKINFSKQPLHEQVIKICSSLMNNSVVEIMNNKNNLVANDKFINGYFAIYRLLTCYAEDDSKITEYCDRSLSQFMSSVDRRSKQYCANLGELLIYLLVSKKYTWKDIATVFQEECDARNVFWYIAGTYTSRGKYPELKDTTVLKDRAKKVFDATPISRTLVMFQVKFCQVAKGLDLDTNFGLAPEKVRLELKNTYNTVTKAKDWNDYFKWLDLPLYSEKDRDIQLANAVKVSLRQKYHK